MWEPQWEALTERFRAVRCDLRGFGDSPLPPESFNNADDVLRLLDALGIERASVVGASFGGRVALELAATWPARGCEKLVLLCGAWEGSDPDPALKSFAAEENRLLDAGDVDGAVELNVRTWLGPDASDASRSLVEAMQRRAFEVQLEAGDNAATRTGTWTRAPSEPRPDGLRRTRLPPLPSGRGGARGSHSGRRAPGAGLGGPPAVAGAPDPVTDCS